MRWIASPRRGSSPLTRGKLPSRRSIASQDGLIPAHAGKTAGERFDRVPSEAHPRSRGENVPMRRQRRCGKGSSPLTRGKRGIRRTSRLGRGLIPAHAGKTSVMTMHGGASRAHPRSRGENLAVPYGVEIELGSSPLTRGKLKARPRCLGANGLIPAHAGKTPTLRYASASARAHPRSRGENGSLDESAHVLTGSSPLTRGKPSPKPTPAPVPGLIPAHAGKTSLPSRWRRPARAHPRSRGENFRASRACTSDPGSSPLTRGKRPVPGLQGGHPGLIPAHAGKTGCRRSARGRRRAHPRSRGENSRGELRRKFQPGSSPLTRGKPMAPRRKRENRRLIPAHAGKTHQATCPTLDTRAHPRSRGENLE